MGMFGEAVYISTDKRAGFTARPDSFLHNFDCKHELSSVTSHNSTLSPFVMVTRSVDTKCSNEIAGNVCSALTFPFITQ